MIGNGTPCGWGRERKKRRGAANRKLLWLNAQRIRVFLSWDLIHLASGQDFLGDWFSPGPCSLVSDPRCGESAVDYMQNPVPRFTSVSVHPHTAHHTFISSFPLFLFFLDVNAFFLSFFLKKKKQNSPHTASPLANSWEAHPFRRPNPFPISHPLTRHLNPDLRFHKRNAFSVLKPNAIMETLDLLAEQEFYGSLQNKHMFVF